MGGTGRSLKVVHLESKAGSGKRARNRKSYLKAEVVVIEVEKKEGPNSLEK